MAIFVTTLALTLSALFSPTLGQLTDAATLSASIRSDAGYSLLPDCINQCIWDIGGGDTNDIGGDLAEHLSCGRPWINGCYCRTNSATYAHSFITGCASYLCTTPKAEDIASGTSVYASYCSAALGGAYKPEEVEQNAGPTDAVFTMSTASTAVRSAATSRPSTRPAKETGGVDTSDPSSTDAAKSGSSGSSNNNTSDERIWGLSKGAFIGVIVSITCSILGLVFGVGFKIYKHKKEQRRQGELHSGPNGFYVTTK